MFIKQLKSKETSLAIIGLGYVGLPLAVEFAKIFNVVGFDISEKKLNDLRNGIDTTGEIESKELKKANINYTNNPSELKKCTTFIVTVPTPIDENKQPNLGPIKSASKLVGQQLSKNAIIIYESTVYPGVTEEICKPILEKESKLIHLKDFHLGYSPERISPGDTKRTLTKILKIVSGDTPEICDEIAELYNTIVEPGTYKAPSIKVAEAAKVIENIQRDLNVALMNELAIIFNKMNINTLDVIEAASTKWNFMKMVPGLVGGHCIDVDPYYLTFKSKQLGYYPQVILSGRRINSHMPKYIAEQTVKQLIKVSKPVKDAHVLILGVTFKENVSDIRNTKVIEIVKELDEYGVKSIICDPHADPEETLKEYGINLCKLEEAPLCDAVILAVPHKEYLEMPFESLQSHISGSNEDKVLIDIKGALRHKENICACFVYWSL